MQEIQLLTREDIVDIVEHELRDQFELLRIQLIESVQANIAAVLREDLPDLVETLLDDRLKNLRIDILKALEDAVRQATLESSPSSSADLGADLHE